MRWDLAFDDPALEREFRREMVARHRRPVTWIVAATTGLTALQLPFDLANGVAYWIATRVACLAFMVPIAIATAALRPDRFERLITALAVSYVLANVAYFTATVPGKGGLVPIGSDMAGMLMLTLVGAVGIGVLSIVSTRVVASLAVTSAVLTSIATALALHPDAGQAVTYATIQAAAAVIGVLTAHALQDSRRREFVQARELDRERARSEALLHNVLPAEIAERLKDRPGTIAERFDEATVLFADLVGFTSLAERLSPERLVALLDEVFSEFDEIAERHGLEKIKTIGDAYMVVGGVPARRDDHVEAVASMALEMRAAIARRSTPDAPLRVRIGIHTGPVVAGVIGKKKFIYDLWGDTVNTASRMESHGVEGGIQVTTEVRDRLPARFTVEPRGEITVKGKGALQAFLLTGAT